ncbi:OLC1v1021920C1 [Oldenlandia corymbosa var. corymbosa]|uniref:OLC1v1021920C1 n=1 Tax=Oldenlandia corymbosa var. corymbosa TaxID=529605 RepID=A0AAV1CAH4_OLDCO|nr:OLC1v1021920C1 [Oldenlandia corymbosa var. corymbosa]
MGGHKLVHHGWRRLQGNKEANQLWMYRITTMFFMDQVVKGRGGGGFVFVF